MKLNCVSLLLCFVCNYKSLCKLRAAGREAQQFDVMFIARLGLVYIFPGMKEWERKSRGQARKPPSVVFNLGVLGRGRLVVYVHCASRLLALRDLPWRLTSPIPGAWRPAQARHATPHRVQEV